MKKYIKPEVKKIEVDSDVIRMFSKQNFADLFWEKLAEARKTDQAITQEAVFDMLNEKYERAIGCTRYSSYDSFKQRLNK